MNVTHTRHSLSLDNMLGEKKIELDGREQDLDLREATLLEAWSQGLDPWDNYNELMELIKLWRCLKEVEVECIAMVGRLAILVRDISMVLVDLGMLPIPGIPWDLHAANDILEVASTILEHL
jgi:hypothetical protein